METKRLAILLWTIIGLMFIGGIGYRLVAGPPAPGPAGPQPLPDYRLVGRFAAVRTVFVSEQVLADRQKLGRVAEDIAANDRTDFRPNLQIDFFDSADKTPYSYPMSREEMSHWRAQYDGKQQTLRYISAAERE